MNRVSFRRAKRDDPEYHGIHDKSAKDIMTHRKNINALDDTTLLKDAIVYMSEHSNSRYPVYHEDIDNIVGFIHIKDAMEHQNRQNMKPKA